MKVLIIFIVIFCFLSCAPHYTLVSYIKGDCIDRAVIIRENLEKQGYETRIVLGIMQQRDVKYGHAWVEYKDTKSNKWIRIDNY